MSGLEVWLDDGTGWTEVPGISRVTFEQHDTPPLPTPIERALIILRPHLAAEPLYSEERHRAS
ncbi:hypothetical protein [Streptomyces sp. 900116325]